jgi:hypothetical protein
MMWPWPELASGFFAVLTYIAVVLIQRRRNRLRRENLRSRLLR